MKKILAILLISVLAVFVYLAYPFFLRRAFNISGNVYLPPSLIRKASYPNTLLFLTVENSAGIPVAVKRVVNPVFPFHFHITSDNLILPDPPPWQEKLRVQAHINRHGQVGQLNRGDMLGYCKNTAYILASGLSIMIDREIEDAPPPSVKSQAISQSRGRRIFPPSK